MLYPQPDSIALIMSPFLPFKKFLPNLPSVLACPITTSIADRRLNHFLIAQVVCMIQIVQANH